MKFAKFVIFLAAGMLLAIVFALAILGPLATYGE